MRVYQAWTRVLLPFQIHQAGSSDGIHQLVRIAFPADSSPWLRFDPERNRPKVAHSEYMLEYQLPVRRFLFEAAGSSGCHYLKLDTRKHATALTNPSEVWIAGLEIETRNQSGSAPTPRALELLGLADGGSWKAARPFGPENRLPLRVALDRNTGVELWISQLGVGVVSLCFRIEPEAAADFSFEQWRTGLLEFHHAVATGHKAVWLRPAEGSSGGSPSSADAENEQMQPHLHQFLRQLLAPLWGQPGTEIHFEQRGLTYSALEVEVAGDLDAASKARMLSLLSHLAQLHPATHPGEGEDGFANAVEFNRRHLLQLEFGRGRSRHACPHSRCF